MKKIILISIIFSCFICCHHEKAKLEVIVYLKDMYGNPIANRWTYLSGYLSARDSLQTDKDGRVAYNTIWSLYNDSGDIDWSLAPKKDKKYTPVNFVFPTRMSEKEISITDTIKMDTLKNIKIRLKSLRNDLVEYSILFGRSGYKPGYNNGMNGENYQPRIFNVQYLLYFPQLPAPPVHNSLKVDYGIDFGKYRSAKLPSQDTVINIKAYSKAAFSIVIRPYYVGNLLLPDKELIVKENQDRNGTILFEY